MAPEQLSLIIAGITSGVLLFLVAAGLALIFGVSKIINFAHGSLFMLGAYFAHTMTSRVSSPWMFWLSIVAAATAIGGVGATFEVLLLRRFYDRSALHQLLITFALSLIVQDLTRWKFGAEDILSVEAPGLSKAFTVFGSTIPVYNAIIASIGIAVVVALSLALRCTRWGMLIRAVSDDPVAAASLGVNHRIVRTAAFTCGAALAGFAGALQTPIRALTPSMDSAIIISAFAVVIIGGMGSIPGAFVASLLIGLIQAFGIVYFPKATLSTPFILMAAILIVRRRGLVEGDIESHPSAPLHVQSRLSWVFWGSGLCAVFLTALLGPRYWAALMAEVAVFALFAAATQGLISTAGMMSFGHAAPFGIGTYTCALAVIRWHCSFPLALALGVVTAAVTSLIAGVSSVASRGVYFAMLSLAFCEILQAGARLSQFTGGDNGLIGVRWWPGQDWRTHVLVVIAICVAGIAVLLLFDQGRFGLRQRAVRDNPARAASSGLSIFSMRLRALILASAAAGLAGALFALNKRGAFPDMLSAETSIQPILMVLTGGTQTFGGGPLGAVALRLGESYATSHTTHWQLSLGVFMVLLLLVRPSGILAGVVKH